MILWRPCYWSVILGWGGGQSSLTMCRLNLNLRILGEIMVRHTGGGGQSSFTMCRLKLKFKTFTSISPAILKLTFSLHMVKDDWPPRYDRPDQYLTSNFSVQIYPAHGQRWLIPPGMTDQTRTSSKIFKFRFSLHMVKDDWPPPGMTDQDLT